MQQSRIHRYFFNLRANNNIIIKSRAVFIDRETKNQKEAQNGGTKYAAPEKSTRHPERHSGTL